LLKGIAQLLSNPNSTLLGPKFKFEKYGQSWGGGSGVQNYCRNFSTIVDDVAIVKSM